MNVENLKPARATTQKACLFRVQIPAGYVDKVLEAIINITPLRYGNYEQVAFRYSTGTQQYKPPYAPGSGDRM